MVSSWPHEQADYVKVKVRRSKWGKSGRTPRHHWNVSQRTTPTTVRVFTYARYWQAINNANRLACHKPISTFGLRGFHIEGDRS